MMWKEVLNPANYFFNPWALPNYIGALYASFLAMLIFKHNRKLLGFSLLSVTMSLVVWMVGFSLVISSRNPDVGYVVSRYSSAFGVWFITVNIYFFSLVLSGNLKQNLKKLIFYYCCILTFVVINFFTDWLIESPPMDYFFGYYTNVNFLHNVYLLVWGWIGLEAVINLYKNYKRQTNPLEKRRARLLFLMIVIGNIAVIDYLPSYGFEFYPVGFVFIILYATILTYNVIHYKAFDIETVIHKTLLWIITLVLLILPPSVIFLLVLEKSIVLSIPVFARILVSGVLLLLFYHYYHHLRPFIDHIFRRRKYDYLQILGTLSQQISGIIDLEKLSEKTVLSIKETVYPQNIHLFLKDDKKNGYYLKLGMTGNNLQSFTKENTSLFIPQDSRTLKILMEHDEPLERDLLDLDPKYKSIREETESLFQKTETVLLLGLRLEEELVGLLFLGRKEDLTHYTHREIDALGDLSSSIAGSFYTSLHHHDILEKQRLQQEIFLASNIQENFLPQEPPKVAGLSLFGLYVPSKEIGGDYYDFLVSGKETMDTPQGKIYITIGDVSGKGLDAGLVVSSVKSFLVSFTQYHDSCKAILNLLNQSLYTYLHQQKFISLLLFRYLPAENKIAYSSAGHEHIFIYRASEGAGQVEVIKSGGVILGMIENIEHFLEETTLSLNRGDKVFVYTDGATEARNPDEDLFGFNRLLGSFKNHAHLPVKDMVSNVYHDIKTFISTRDHYDDITLVGIEKD